MSTKAALICADCLTIRGIKQLADYVFVPAESLLEGPAMGQPDYAPVKNEGEKGLCEACYTYLGADEKLCYARVDEEIEEL